jgi:hypothetical protein
MSNKPPFYAYAEKDRGRGRDPILIRIGAAWPHEKGKGCTIQIDAMPLNFDGRIVLFEPKSDDSQEPAPEAEAGEAA